MAERNCVLLYLPEQKKHIYSKIFFTIFFSTLICLVLLQNYFFCPTVIKKVTEICDVVVQKKSDAFTNFVIKPITKHSSICETIYYQDNSVKQNINVLTTIKPNSSSLISVNKNIVPVATPPAILNQGVSLNTYIQNIIPPMHNSYVKTNKYFSQYNNIDITNIKNDLNSISCVEIDIDYLSVCNIQTKEYYTNFCLLRDTRTNIIPQDIQIMFHSPIHSGLDNNQKKASLDLCDIYIENSDATTKAILSPLIPKLHDCYSNIETQQIGQNNNFNQQIFSNMYENANKIINQMKSSKQQTFIQIPSQYPNTNALNCNNVQQIQKNSTNNVFPQDNSKIGLPFT